MNNEKNLNTELIQNKLALMDNLVKLKLCKDKLSLFIPLTMLTKTDPYIEFIHQRRICQSLIQSIKNSKDELKFTGNNKNAVNLDQEELKELIFTLQTIAYETIYFARKFDSLKPENIFADYESLHAYAPARELKILFSSRSYKNNLIKEFNSFMLKFCRHIKDIIEKLNNINNIKDYEFDISFAEYYFELLLRDMKKEKYFENDIMTISELYKKVYKIIDQLEKIKNEPLKS